MTVRPLLPCLLLVALTGCRSPGADCRAIDGWRQGESGGSPLPGCIGAPYREAHELGRSLHALLQERAELDQRIAVEADNAGVLRRRQRQIDIDVEAIRGLAVIEGWSRAGR
jgi:hypothetical protein